MEGSRMKALKLGVCVWMAATAFALTAAAAEPDIRALAPGATPGAATLNDLKGLVGQWAGPQGAASFSAPIDGQIVGYLVLLSPEKKTLITELWIFRAERGSVLVRQKHITPDLKQIEDKEQWAERALVAVDSGHVYLNNLTWITKGSSLGFEVQIPMPNGAPPRLLSASFARVK
jgi:Domain of unknown function (DUF6265)